jgi:hypothetical protein
MKKFAIVLCLSSLLLSACSSESSTEATPADIVADEWLAKCNELPNSESCHSAADKVRDQGTVYGYELNGQSFRSQISFPITDKCAVKNPSDDCAGELNSKRLLGFEGLVCVSDSPLGSICFTKILIRNLESGSSALRLNATLTDTEGNIYEPNVSGEVTYNYLPLNFTQQFAKKLNPGQAEYWQIAFNVAGKLDGFSKIYLTRVGPYERDTLFLLPIQDEDPDFQAYEEAWYANVSYERSEETMWSPEFTRSVDAP